MSYTIIILTGFMASLMLIWPHRKSGNVVYLSPLKWFGIGTLVLFVVQPLNHLQYDKLTMDSLDPEWFDFMGEICLVSAFFFFLGWLIWPSFRSKRSCNSYRMMSTRKYPGRIVLVIPASLAIASLVLSYGSLDSFIDSTINPFETLGGDYYNIFSLLLSSLLVFGLVGLAEENAKAFSSKWLISFLACVLFFILSLKLGARTRVMFLVLGIGGILATQMSRKSFVVMTTIATLLLIIFIYVHARLRHEFRFTMELEKISERLDGSSDWYSDFFMSGDFDAFENGLQAVKAVNLGQDFLYGSTFFSVVYNPIPRVYWPDKPSPSVVELLINSELGQGGGSHHNIACSLPAELYVNFWWFGVVFGMMFFGAISKHVYSRLSQNPKDGVRLLQLGCYSAYTVLVLRGSFHTMTIFYLTFVFWMWVVATSTWLIDPQGRGSLKYHVGMRADTFKK